MLCYGEGHGDISRLEEQDERDGDGKSVMEQADCGTSSALCRPGSAMSSLSATVLSHKPLCNSLF